MERCLLTERAVGAHIKRDNSRISFMFALEFCRVSLYCNVLARGANALSTEEINHYFQDKMKEVAVFVVTVVADVIVISIWLAGEFLFEKFVVPTFPVNSFVNKLVFSVFRSIFLTATVIPCAINAYKHIHISVINAYKQIHIFWEQSKAKIQSVKEQLNSKPKTDNSKELRIEEKMHSFSGLDTEKEPRT